MYLQYFSTFAINISDTIAITSSKHPLPIFKLHFIYFIYQFPKGNVFYFHVFEFFSLSVL